VQTRERIHSVRVVDILFISSLQNTDVYSELTTTTTSLLNDFAYFLSIGKTNNDNMREILFYRNVSFNKSVTVIALIELYA
jgi:hypothetical protein